MVGRDPTERLPKYHADAQVRVGLRTGRLQELALRALANGRIGKTRARQVLAVELSEPLPEGAALSEEERAPLQGAEHLARVSALRFLIQRGDLAGCFPGRVTRDGNRFRVEVKRADQRDGDPSLPAQYLTLSAAFEVMEQESLIPSGASAGV